MIVASLKSFSFESSPYGAEFPTALLDLQRGARCVIHDSAHLALTAHAGRVPLCSQNNRLTRA